MSGGVLLLVAAVLWVAYLFPTMIRRRHDLASERNAVRLQQTLRVIAEAAETPQEVRVEANARAIYAQQRMLAKLEHKEELENLRALAAAEAERKAAERAAMLASKAAAKALSVAEMRARIRRRRAATSLCLLLALMTTTVGLMGLAWGMTWMVSAAGATGAVLSLLALSHWARSAHALTERPVSAPVSQSADRFDVSVPSVTPQASTWTPQSLPAPLHLSPGSRAAATIASNDALEQLRRRAREIATESVSAPSTRIRNVAAVRHNQEMQAHSLASRPASTSASTLRRTEPSAARVEGSSSDLSQRLASMGIVDSTETSFNVTDVLQRRRAV